MLITGREGSGKLVASLSAGTVIRKETKEPNNRVLLGALLLGCHQLAVWKRDHLFALVIFVFKVPLVL